MEKELLSAIDQLSQKFSTNQRTLQEARHIISDTIMKISEPTEQKDLIEHLEDSDSSDLSVLRKIIKQFHEEGKQMTQSVRSSIARMI